MVPARVDSTPTAPETLVIATSSINTAGAVNLRPS